MHLVVEVEVEAEGMEDMLRTGEHMEPNRDILN